MSIEFALMLAAGLLAAVDDGWVLSGLVLGLLLAAFVISVMQACRRFRSRRAR